jgi:hypothetical protein
MPFAGDVMAKKKLDKFIIESQKKARKITDELERYLLTVRFSLEEQGKRNATDDFYQTLTRSGMVRTWPLTGRLRNSINARIKRKDNDVEVILQAGGFSGGGNVNYAGALEFGKKRHPRIKPYFFLGRAVQKEQKSLKKDLRKFLKMELGDLV